MAGSVILSFPTVNRMVAGSSPARGANLFNWSYKFEALVVGEMAVCSAVYVHFE
jgi:hypothetical protein